MHHHTYKGYVDLTDRRLWCDGDISITPESVTTFILKNKVKKLYTTKKTKAITKYNQYASEDERIDIKLDLHLPEVEWRIPQEYKDINLKHFIMEKFFQMSAEYSDARSLECIERIQYELKIFKKHDLFMLLRTLIYMVDTFEEKGVVWGVGRGSSVSSYILYILGVHDIDSVQYDLNFNDFLQ